MRILVLGRSGQLASALAERAQAHPGIILTSLGRPEIDLAQAASLGEAIAAQRPHLVVNAAAYTAVDRAEAEHDAAFAVNCQGAAAAAAAAARLGVPFIHISTDYVYSGAKREPYVETDATAPLGAYGRSKLAGEKAVREAHPDPLILRTSWVFSPFGANFLKTMLRLGAERAEIGVVDDQHGNPTSALDLADAILRIAPGLAAGGTYHLCNSGSTSWCGFARHIFAASHALGGPSPAVRAITTADYPTPARRPANSRLSTDAFAARFGFSPRPWQEATDDVVRRLLRG